MRNGFREVRRIFWTVASIVVLAAMAHAHDSSDPTPWVMGTSHNPPRTYGHWCGENWSGGRADGRIGNAPPINDGGLDSACRDHDLAWARAGTDRRNPAVRRAIFEADRRFLDAVRQVRLRTTDPTAEVALAVARGWMTCRVRLGADASDADLARCGTWGTHWNRTIEERRQR